MRGIARFGCSYDRLCEVPRLLGRKATEGKAVVPNQAEAPVKAVGRKNRLYVYRKLLVLKSGARGSMRTGVLIEDDLIRRNPPYHNPRRHYCLVPNRQRSTPPPTHD